MRREKRKKGCFGRMISFVVYLFAAMVVLNLISATVGGNSGNTNRDTTYSVETRSEANADTSTEKRDNQTPEPTHKPTPKPNPVKKTPEPTATPTPEPTTLQGWAEHVANSVYGSFDPKYSSLISVECEQVDGEKAPMIIVNAKYPDTFMRDNDTRMGLFLYHAMNMTWKLNDLAKEGKIEYGSVFIHGRTTFVDKYGNETEGDAAAIRIKASEAEKVNWSISTFRAEMMPGIAVSFMIHPIIRDGISAEYLREIRK